MAKRTINWSKADVESDSVVGALVTALYERGHSLKWCNHVARTIDEDYVWSVLGPILDSLEEGEYHDAGADAVDEA